MRRFLVMAAAAVMLLSACAGDGATGSTTTTLQIVTTSSPPATNVVGRPLVSALMNDLGPSMGAGTNTFAGERFRVSAELEADFVAALRETSTTGEIPADLDRFDDEELLYLGYFYCLALDAGLDNATAAQGVVVSVLAERGAPDTEPTTEDV
ncbi:MAG: hypothetical protein KJO84_05370, partial [Acidimicrobiia bacterium]|nr:hypothetical protein [Acidimicrobiia bacterium]